jgi:hypothetical protein
MKSYYRGRTPLVLLFRQLSGELQTLEDGVKAAAWLARRGSEVYGTLAKVDQPLALELLSVLEGHPGSLNVFRDVNMTSLCLVRAVDRVQTTLASFCGEVFKVKPQTLVAVIGEALDVDGESLALGDALESPHSISFESTLRLGSFNEWVASPRPASLFASSELASEYLGSTSAQSIRPSCSATSLSTA